MSPALGSVVVYYCILLYDNYRTTILLMSNYSPAMVPVPSLDSPTSVALFFDADFCSVLVCNLFEDGAIDDYWNEKISFGVLLSRSFI